MPDRSEKLRHFYARYVTALGGVRDPRIERAFSAVPREVFAGVAPWDILAKSRRAASDYIPTPDDDLAYIYQDTLIAIDSARGINIGQPSLHARCLDAVRPTTGETVVQVGAGTGYYTAILAELVGSGGRVVAFEIEPELAKRAAANLAPWPWAEVRAQSGTGGSLPPADVIYVNAGITHPDPAWLEALRPQGRLLFPLQAPHRFGVMLLLEKPDGAAKVWPAQVVTRAGFIACNAAQDEELGRRLNDVLQSQEPEDVKSFHLGAAPDESCWFDGNGWWLSTAEPD